MLKSEIKKPTYVGFFMPKFYQNNNVLDPIFYPFGIRRFLPQSGGHLGAEDILPEQRQDEVEQVITIFKSNLK
ncbi:hypothetical protein FGD67_18775 [Colwellia sp. M166]|uniref:hypothetical protein n=1 Tax=Colwellia sp. M166 TaxID=2583805 RepID=UPI00211F3DC3|nr:hypothetical protein [Colwellia sp. M166]UUO25026.1 hypothetical protein FGD67_18775 [Colwellia sp. M166]